MTQKEWFVLIATGILLPAVGSLLGWLMPFERLSAIIQKEVPPSDLVGILLILLLVIAGIFLCFLYIALKYHKLQKELSEPNKPSLNPDFNITKI